jgi:hypothetical protein
MFFRFIGTRRKAIDLNGAFSGACFLLGGSPQLNQVKDLLVDQPIVTAAMNNTAAVVRPNIWIGADIPINYSASVVLDPAPMKFAFITRRDHPIGDVTWKDVPNTYFMSSKQEGAEAFFLKNRDFTWGKNIFTVSLQVLYRLGFTTVYTVGCAFHINKNYQYCYDTDLNDAQVDWTARTYDMVLRQMRDILKHKPNSFQVVSCTPNSRLNDLVGFCKLEDAIGNATIGIPAHQTKGCRHPVD